MPRKPILCLDFDGVLHSYTSGWKGAHIIPDPPVPGAMDFLRRVFEHDRFDVAVYSTRSKSMLGRWAMKRWLFGSLRDEFGYMMAEKSWDPLCHEIADWVKWPWFKPPALVTIDDRALTFNGDWSIYTPNALGQFKPWNKP